MLRKSMSHLLNIFNNREIALFIWFFLFLAWALSKRKIRKSFVGVFKAFLRWKISTSVFYMILYVSLLITVFYKIRFWDTLMLKDTFYWFFGIAFIMLVNSNKANEEDHYFKKVLLDNLKLAVVLEFIINLYVFNLVVELILIPILIFIIMVNAFAETKKEYLPVNKLMINILTFVGICLVIFSFKNIVTDFKSFTKIDNLRSFLLPPVFTFAYLPFIYLMALYIKYENIYLRMDLFNEDKKILKYAKRKIFVLCHFNLRKLNKLSKRLGIIKIDNENDVQVLLQRIKGK